MTEKQVSPQDLLTLMNHQYNVEAMKKDIKIAELERKVFVNGLYVKYGLTETDSIGFDGKVTSLPKNDSTETEAKG